MVGWWAIICYLYYRQPGMQFHVYRSLQFLFPKTNLSIGWFWEHLKLAGAFAWFVLLGLGLGNLLLILFRVPLRSRFEWIAMSLGLGWGMMGLGFAALGFLKLWSPHLVYASLAVLSIGLVIYTLKTGIVGVPPDRIGPWSSVEKIMVDLIALLMLTSLIGALMPEIFYDAWVYHLALPELYWVKGGVFPTPHNLYSGFPQLMEMVYGLALPFGDRLCHLIHWGFGVLTALLIYAFCLRLRRRSSGLMGALLFYSSPLVGLLSCKSGVELGQTFFQFLTIYALAIGLDDQDHKDRWLLLAGIGMGFALGMKYTAWPLFVLVALVLLFHSFREGFHWKLFLKSWAICILPAALLGSIWLVRNLAFYRNPIFPFFHELFYPSGPKVMWAAMAAEGRGRNLQSLFSSWEGIGSYLLSPWLIDTQWLDLDCLGPILILGLPLLIVFRYKGRPLQFSVGFAVGLFWLLSLLTTMARFFVPVVPFLLLAYAIAIEDGFQGLGRALARTFFCAIVIVNLLTTACYLGMYRAQDVIWGVQSQETYLNRNQPTYAMHCRPATNFIREHLPNNVRVLVLGGARGYGMGRDYVASPQFNESLITQYLKRADTPEALRELMKAGGFTHILYNYAELYLRRDFWIQADRAKLDVMSAFNRKYVRSIFEIGDPESVKQTSVWCGVGEIRLNGSF
jgi:uncharacterized membrane protein